MSTTGVVMLNKSWRCIRFFTPFIVMNPDSGQSDELLHTHQHCSLRSLQYFNQAHVSSLNQWKCKEMIRHAYLVYQVLYWDTYHISLFSKNKSHLDCRDFFTYIFSSLTFGHRGHNILLFWGKTPMRPETLNKGQFHTVKTLQYICISHLAIKV